MNFTNFLTLSESIFDQYLFKGLMVLGGPGSGKTQIMQQAIKPAGFRLAVPDEIFEMYLQHAGLTAGNLLDPTKYTVPGFQEPVSQFDMFAKAKKTNLQRVQAYSKSMIPYACEVTGQHPHSLAQAVHAWHELGYDPYAILVHTPKNIALQRLAARPIRSQIVTADKIHDAVTTNWPAYQELFKGNTFVIDNSHNSPAQAIKEALYIATTILKNPLKNPLGLQRIHDEITNFPQLAKHIPMAKQLKQPD